MTSIINFRRPLLIQGLSAPKGFGDSTLRDPRPDAIELLGGIPDPLLLPTDELAEATARILKQPGAPSLQYGRTEGLTLLREWIADREQVPVEEILITNGGFHGLSLALSLVVERGDLVAVDNPVFPLFLRGLELNAGQILPINVDNQGLNVDELEAKLLSGHRISALYTVPDFHNPTQATLSVERRRKLVELADRFGFIVIADNPYRELRFGPESADVTLFNTSNQVIHVNTFTKTLGPGLRLGWVRLPKHLIKDGVALRSRQDSHTSLLVQSVVADYLTSSPGVFDDLLDTARSVYRSRALTLATALEKEAPGAFSIPVPEGGFFLWPKLTNPDIDSDKLAEAASAHGVEYQRGAFFSSGSGTDADRRLRLAYSNVNESQIAEAARRLANALQSLG